MTPTNPPIRKPRKKKATTQVADLQAQIAVKDALIAQYQRDAARDADLIDMLANQVREQQKPQTNLPERVEWGWLRQSDSDCEAASRELTRKWAEGWRIYQIDHTATGRDVTLWRPAQAAPAPLTRSTRRTTSASITAAPTPAMRVPVQPGVSTFSRVVVVNHVDEMDFDADRFIEESNRRAMQKGLEAYQAALQTQSLRPSTRFSFQKALPS